MKILRKKQPRETLLAADYNNLIDAINEVRIVQSNDVKPIRTAGGTALSIVHKKTATTAAEEEQTVSAGGLVELHQEWVNTVYSWRVNERVIYKPSGSAYYLVYQCNDATATNTDIPNASSKWTKITNWTNEAYWVKETEYTAGQTVLYLGGLYTAAATSTGVEPGTNEDMWTKTADSLIGIKSYPMQIGGEDVYTPYAEHYQWGMKYDSKTPSTTTNALYFGQRRIERFLDGTYKITPISDLIEWAPTLDHG